MTTHGKFRAPRGRSITFLGFCLALLLFGCSSGPANPGVALVDAQGNHAASFLSIHPGYAVSDVDQCRACHGSDLSGGIAKTSCFTAACHHDPDPSWANFDSHGAAAKRAPGNSGFASCRICHANDFSGGGAGVACSSCHGVPAPHPPAPWRAATDPTHTDTDPANAPVCAGCHFPGSPNNPSGHPATPAPAGTPPGCFNSTLCHGTPSAPHPVGGTWVAVYPAAQPHGTAAKAPPAATAGFAYCQACHGTGSNFAGGSSGTSCYTCHGTSAPHPFSWRFGDTYLHSATDPGNAVVCVFCHANGANSPIGPPSPPAPAGTPPDCFNNTLCHGPSGAPHSVPFLSHTGVTASTFNDPFPAGCAACHAVSGTSPLSAAPVCVTCHTSGSPLAQLACTSCHAAPPDGPSSTAAYPNKSGAHAVHLGLNGAGTPVSCDTCHSGLGTTTQAHYDRAKAKVPPGDAAFGSTYDAQSGAPSFDNVSLTCTNVSCHGGQTTPNWQTGTLDVNVRCNACHVYGTTQYNSFNSGQHNRHVNNLGYACTVCHNTTALAAAHFNALSTPGMEGPASDTIGGGSTFIPAGHYNPSTGSCYPSCHGTENW